VQIEFFFTCRECGADTRILWDTSHSGDRDFVQLKCSSSRCGHVSGKLHLSYIYREEHRPSREREGFVEGPDVNGR